MPTLSTEELEALCLIALEQSGMRPQDAALASAHFLHNELSGKSSHGLVRVIEAAKSVQKFGAPQIDPDIEKETEEFFIMNARRHVGAVAVQWGVDEAIKRVRHRALFFAGVRDYIASSGSLSYYLEQVADAGFIGIMGCNSVALVSAPAGKKRVIGTNPLGIAIPGNRSNSRLITDIATSAIAYGKIMVMNEKGQAVPEGMLIDKDGKPSVNPKDAYDGAILPLAGYKGFGLGLMIELLAGPLISARAVKDELYDNDGFFMILINPEKFGNPHFYEQISEALDEIKSGEPTEDYEFITLPGERSAHSRTLNMKSGTVDIPDQTLEKLLQLVQSSNL